MAMLAWTDALTSDGATGTSKKAAGRIASTCEERGSAKRGAFRGLSE